MRALIQRVSYAAVDIDGDRTASIGRGLLVLLGVFPDDDERVAADLAAKTAALRIFPGDDKPMNASLKDVGGEALVVSQFTLAADTRRGNRPGFSSAAAPEHAEPLYRHYVAALAGCGVAVQTGEFGADMLVSLTNDGPVTILLERQSG